MKKVLLLLVAIVTLASCEQAKTAYVDSTEMMKNYDKNKAIEADFKMKSEKLKKEFDSIGGLLQQEYETLKSKAPKIGRKKAEAQLQELGRKQQYFEQALQQQRQLIIAESQGKMDTLSMNVKKFIKDYGKKNGYTYIYNSGDEASVLYGDAKLDITDAITKALNGGEETKTAEKK